MASNPYIDLEPRAFWRSAVAEATSASAGVYRKKFDIDHSARIATAGSCFAQHIGVFLKANGYQVLDVEPPPQWMPAPLRRQYGYDVYSARYGNIYTVAQLAQLAAECNGAYCPGETAWVRGDGRYLDALRPAVEPDGFETLEELNHSRRYHLQQVRRLFTEMDVFIFTLGLTEAWVHRESMTFFGSAPGTVGGVYDEAKYAFVNLGYQDLINAFASFFSTLEKLRGGSMPRTILTVSPVPLTATASDQHILVANTYSKATLRAAAGELAKSNKHIDYFPSYEIVTNPNSRGAFFEENLRSVRTAGVKAVMSAFFEAHPSFAPIRSSVDASLELDCQMALQCEEELLDAFSK